MKKIWAMILTATLFCTLAVPAFAETETSTNLEKAILTVKAVTTIPETYTDFTYSTYESEKDGDINQIWELNWSNPDGKGGLSATIDQDGNMTSYYLYRYNQEQSGLAKITKEDGNRIAKEFLNKAISEASQMKQQINYVNNGESSTYQYTYMMYKQNLPVPFQTAYLNVDKYTGEVTSFNKSGDWRTIATYPIAENIVTIDSAKASYIEKIGIDLKYTSYYDSEKKKLKVFPIYMDAGNYNEAIAAKTGDVVLLYQYNDYYGGYYSTADKSKAENEGSGTNFTEEELAEIQNTAGLISKAKAESLLKQYVTNIKSTDTVQSASLYRNTIDTEKYIWNLSFETAFGSIDAKTGELLSFSLFGDETTNGIKSVSKEAAQIQVENFLKKIALEKFSKTKLSDDEDPIIIYYDTKEQSDTPYYNFNYVRQENGIDFISNQLYATYDKTTGMIISYSSEWYDNITFPSIDGVIGESKAFDKIAEEADFKLMYGKTSKDEAVLIYDFAEDSSFMLDPFTGDRLDYNGEKYQDKEVTEYSDLTGHWSESTVNQLLENGYYIQNDKFNPGQNITQIGFLRYLYTPTSKYYSSDQDFYEMLVNSKIINENEIAATQILTRQEAAKFTVRVLGLEKAAVHSEIYRTMFKDKIANEYIGYSSIAYGLGIIKGNGNGYFNGTNALSNAEAAVIIYNYLSVR